jgi:hypothetical protein
MKSRKNWKSRALLWVSHVLLVAGLVATGQVARAQEDRPAPKSYLNKGTVHLPIQIDERVRPLLQEVQLYVKESPLAPWNLKEKVPGTQTFFTFRTAQDGEYWFNVVTVDRNGKSIPADVAKEPPGLIVVIDSTPPQVDIQVLGSAPEGQQIRCEIRDANPDPAKTRMFYQTRDQIWRSVDATAGQPDTFCIPGQAAITGMIRVTASDLARNTVTREFNLATLPVANNTVPPAVNNPSAINNPFAPARPASNVVAENTGDKGVVPPPLDFPTAPAKSSMPTVVSEKFVPVSERIELVANKTALPPVPQGPSLEPSSKTPSLEQPPKMPFAQPASSDIRMITDNAGNSLKLPDVPGKRHLVNHTHVFLDYQIDQTGASGVGRVEIWYTRDMSQTWTKLGEDANRKGQAEADLPGEGIYGLTVVVSNGRGFGGTPPKTGDAPDWWIEVDTTKPQAELLNVRTNPNGDDGSLHISWTAKDKNLHPEPIDLYYAVNRQGPWLPIAKGLKNDGLYRWMPNSVMGTHAFVRLTVNDLAGNSASFESAQPVALDDLSRPRGRLVGVTTTPRTNLGNAPSPMPPTGN